MLFEIWFKIPVNKWFPQLINGFSDFCSQFMVKESDPVSYKGNVTWKFKLNHFEIQSDSTNTYQPVLPQTPFWQRPFGLCEPKLLAKVMGKSLWVSMQQYWNKCKTSIQCLKFITISKRALKMNSLKYCLYRFRNKNSSQDIKSFFLYAFQYQIFRISLISLKYCLYRSTVCSLSYRYQMLFFMIILRNSTVFLVLFNQSTIGYHQIDFKHCLWI